MRKLKRKSASTKSYVALNKQLASKFNIKKGLRYEALFILFQALSTEAIVKSAILSVETR